VTLKEVSPPSARTVAYARLAHDAADFPDLVPAELETGDLDPREAALAHAIHDTVVRRWWTLQAIITPGLSKPFVEVEPAVRGALLAGAAQLVFFDRIPAHAAISETVEWAKRAVRPGAGGLVNAVLRRVAELVGETRTFRDTYSGARDEIPLADGRALVLAREVLPADELARLSAAASIAKPLLESWRETHGDQPGRGWRDLALHTLASPPVTLSIRHATAPVLDVEPHATDVPGAEGFARFTGPMSALGPLLASRDDIWVQDAASGEAIHSVSDLAPRVVVDLCAGKGTKTRQLARTFPDAEIVATDTDAPRLATLRRVFEGGGAAHGRVRVLGFDEVLDDCLGRADLVVLDVPCSNTGVLARRPEAKYRAMTRQHERLTDTQRQIVADAIRLLAPSGAILYSTCSLQPEENQAIARWAKTWHGFTISRERVTLPAGLPGDPPSCYRDGSYSVLLSR